MQYSVTYPVHPDRPSEGTHTKLFTYMDAYPSEEMETYYDSNDEIVACIPKSWDAKVEIVLD